MTATFGPPPSRRETPHTPSGWYPDPTVAGQERYWNGATWESAARPVRSDVSHTISPVSAPIPQPVPSAPRVPAQRQAGPRWWGWALIGAGSLALLEVAALVVVLGVSAVIPAITPAKPTTFTASGHLQFGGGDYNDPCTGTAGYDDITQGAQVVISDAAGKTLGIGALGVGVAEGGTCLFPFTVKGVKLGSKFYGVSITHRGVVQYTYSQLKSGQAALTLG
jgi:hypothetical protein